MLVSEVMLQQTQVARVIDRYTSFLDRFPTPRACAVATVGEVVEAWAGLGYNRRAVRLHRVAVAVDDRHGGRLPAELDALLELPGIGPYTARAVLAFAHERDVGVVDTNAARVLARWAGRALRRGEAQELADHSVPDGHGWAWNQAVLDLGSAICRARDPRCDACPVTETCAWFVAGRPDPDPVVGTAGTGSRQGRFEGSDRQGRGRLVDALRRGPVADDQLAEVMGWPGERDRAAGVAATVVADGLARRDGDVLRLP